MNNIELDSSIQDTNSNCTFALSCFVMTSETFVSFSRDQLHLFNNWPLSISFGLILLFPHLSDYVVFAAKLGH